jgi:hypothetical protein
VLRCREDAEVLGAVLTPLSNYLLTDKIEVFLLVFDAFLAHFFLYTVFSDG